MEDINRNQRCKPSYARVIVFPLADRDAQESKATAGLPRLPPGRHSLDREFVAKNQRDRLTAGIISVVAERGYQEATVTRVCAAAGVSRRTFYAYYSSKKECYLRAFDLIFDHLSEVLTAAGAEEREWPPRVRAQLRAMLGIFASNPDLVRFALIAPLRSGEPIARRQQIALQWILEVLTRDRPEPGKKGPHPPPPAVEEALVGGMMTLIASTVERGEEEHLPDLLPDLVEIFLTPYIGRSRAVDVAAPSS